MSDNSLLSDFEEETPLKKRSRKRKNVSDDEDSEWIPEISLTDFEEETPLKKRPRKRKNVSDDEANEWIPDSSKTKTKKPALAKSQTVVKKSALITKSNQTDSSKSQPPPKKSKKDEAKVAIKKEKATPLKRLKIKTEKATPLKKPRMKKEPNSKILNIKEEKQFNDNFNNIDINIEHAQISNLNSQFKPNLKNKGESDFNTKNELFDEYRPSWRAEDLLADIMGLDVTVSYNIVKLFDDDNTIPFISRYRKDLTGNMDPETLRKAKDSYEMIKGIQSKQQTIIKQLSKNCKLDPVIHQAVIGARSFHELEHIYAPFKVGSKRTKAEAARQIGLENPAMALLHGTEYVKLEPLLNYEIDGLSTILDVENGISHIIADLISKNKDVLDKLRELQKSTHIRIETSKSRSAANSEKAKIKSEKNDKKIKNENLVSNSELESKYQHYFQFNTAVRNIRPHQVLAINRGENQKILSVKFNVPDWLMHKLDNFCRYKFLNKGYKYPLREKVYEKSFKDAYSRLIQPLVIRSVRGELNKEAERASIEVFATNLKKLLLTPPLRGKIVMAVDPGFHHGCKIAVTAPNGSVLDTAVVHINFGNSSKHINNNADFIIKEMVIKHSCETIAIGNGKACRETESYFGHLIKSRWFAPLDIKYTIVSEHGASVYSCSPEAAKEFPDMDPNLISAVSLARRLQDPLGELVKVEPKHLGVGMYQHDVSEKQLNSTLDEVVSECVSFVGVDVNTASHCVLRRVAGLNNARASKILEWRETSGPFTNRQQIRLIKGIGDKSFEQCAGFIRILPQSINFSDDNFKIKTEDKKITKKQKSVNTDLNPLDQTWIHPEMYSVAERFVSKCGVRLSDLGSDNFITKVNETVFKIGLPILAEELGISESQVTIISEGLQQTPDYDIRSTFSKPLFRRSFANVNDLQVGSILTGRVENVTHFGSFVDIGVGISGLIPAQRMKTIFPQLGDRVEVKVINVELQRKRIALDLVQLL